MINLDDPKKFRPLRDQAHQVAMNMLRPISRKYDKAEHADPTEEFIYVVEGQGIMMIDGVAYKVTPQTAIYMPAGAKVSFKNDRDRLVAFQVFGNPGPESKYDSWGTP